MDFYAYQEAAGCLMTDIATGAINDQQVLDRLGTLDKQADPNQVDSQARFNVLMACYCAVRPELNPTLEQLLGKRVIAALKGDSTLKLGGDTSPNSPLLTYLRAIDPDFKYPAKDHTIDNDMPSPPVTRVNNTTRVHGL